MRRLALFVVVCAGVIAANAQTAAHRTPTMGWSSWNTYAARISDTLICRQADACVERGFAAAGYKYINIDDGFFFNRDANGRLVVHPQRFPNSLGPVADYIHSRGLKAGIYSDAGRNTCASYWGEGKETGGIGAGLYGHDDEDLAMYFDEMGFDFIKVDFCGGQARSNAEGLELDPRTRYTEVRQAIDRCQKKDIVYNLCNWNFPGTWACGIADSWRVSEDIYDHWRSIKSIVLQSLYLSAYCGPGHYNDMDMLEVGRSMSHTEDVTHFGLWCIMSSPLLIGCDMESVSEEARELLCNPELIALNQDSLGLQAYVAVADKGAYTLVKDVGTRQGRTRAVALFNPTDEQRDMTLTFADIQLDGEVAVRNLVTRSDEGVRRGSVTYSVPAHGTVLLRLEAERRLERAVYEAETAWLTDYQEWKNNRAVGTAVYVNDASCSNGVKVGWLGGRASNDLQWRDVYVEEDGDYELAIDCMSAEQRAFDLTVNGGASQRFVCNSGAWNLSVRATAKARLHRGFNIVRLSNDSDWMPDIDRMTIKRINN